MVTKNYSQQIIDYFFTEIKEGRLNPGDKLKGERELCDILGVSRPPLREALKALSTIGVLTTRSSSGTYVNRYDEEYLSGVLRFATIFSDELLIDYLQLRKSLESEAAKLAAMNATEEDLTEIKRIIREREILSEIEGVTIEEIHKDLKRLDYLFHIAVAKASKNVVFAEFIKSIGRALSLHQDLSAHSLDDTKVTNKFHRQIYDAIETRQPELSAMIMYKHIETIEQNLNYKRAATETDTSELV